ncbi:response regulator transcription factor [Gottfriedia luciferensis]|uniref:response regulator transcription factor n=1 Tax=Gottfriedia luciferensis TaxID=178774 RepID=UPI000B444294|nr:response regulator [Gottfriedia luciferensis]
MKVLLIDDEKHVREGIKLLANWDAIGVTEILEAENGAIAQNIIKHEKPTIIFTDLMMPELDGRGLLKWLHSESINCKVIVVTGYDDYHYMREAIQFGASDYLLKPIDPDILNETLVKVVSDWNEQEKERLDALNDFRLLQEVLPVYRDKQLTNAIFGKEYNQNLLYQLGYEEGLPLHVSLLKLRNIETFQDIWPEELCHFALLNIVNEVLQKQNEGIAFRNLQKNEEIGLLYWGNNFTEFIHYISKILSSIVPFPFHFANSRKLTTESIQFGYDEAIKVLQHLNILEKRDLPVYTFEDIKDYNLINLVEIINRFEQMVEKQEIYIYDEVIQLFGKRISQQNYLPYVQLNSLHQEFLIFLNHWINKLSLENIQEVNLETFWNAKGHFELEDYIATQRERMQSIIQENNPTNKELNSIEAIANYIQLNYAEEISLQEFSEKFYLSREYISRKFKQIYGVNISDYIVSIRIEKAKELLKFPNLKIYEIAGKIGYQDDKYFRKVFKKIVGMTPNEYRNMNG